MSENEREPIPTQNTEFKTGKEAMEALSQVFTSIELAVLQEAGMQALKLAENPNLRSALQKIDNARDSK